jgi:putative ABC transport system ATP-binding protein
MSTATTNDLEPGMPVIRVSNLNFCFRTGDTWTHTLKNINLEVMPGELVILSGPSGCGKTTILTLLGGLRALHKEDIHITDGEGGESRTVPHGDIELWDAGAGRYRSLRGLEEAEMVAVRRSIGFIFQRHNLLESLTATENIRMAQELLGRTADPTAEAKVMLEYLGLGHRIHYKAQGLSGGQRQRVAIARALINTPRLVLADEPTAALDEVSGERVITLLQHLARQGTKLPERLVRDGVDGLLQQLTVQKGCTSLIVTHDSRIMNEADRIVEMDRGEIKVNVVVAERLLIYRALRRCPAFASVLPEKLVEIADEYSIGLHPDIPVSDERAQKQKQVEVFQPGQVLMRQGEPTGPDSRFYILREGTVSIRQDQGAGEVEVVQLKAGDFFGDRAIIKFDRRNATVVAVDRVVCYAFPFGALRQSHQMNWELVHDFIKRFLDVYGVEARAPEASRELASPA